MAFDLETRKQFDEFAASVKESIAMFKGQDALVKQLQNDVLELKQRLLENTQAGSLELTHGDVGFTNPKHAKDFVNLVRAVFNKDDGFVMSSKDLVEGRDPDGGYLVQPEYRNTLLSLIEQYGVARQYCTVIPMSTTELIMPKLTGGVQVYWIGETQTISETQPSFGEFRMTVKKLAALVPMSSELLADASIAIANLLATLFAQALAKEEDRIVFVGKTTSNDPFNGVLYDPGVGTLTMAGGKKAFTDISAGNLAEAASGRSVYTGGARFFMHRTIFNLVRQLQYTTGEYIWGAPTMGNDEGTIWGFPYTLVESMPSIADTGVSKEFIFFGNLMHYYLGDRQQMTIARSEHVGFAQDKVYLRVLQREGMAYALPETGLAIKTAAS
jgi:HK97 family phage major capsid protein